ncbi:MAG TPA: enoyl-CoA hydratase/isomerase family protein [Polyangiales bacterium]
MEYQTIRTDVAPTGIGTITLHRPERRNALSIQMRLEISACLNEWRDAEQVGAVVLTGSGAAFSAGFDLQEFGQADKLEDVFQSSSAYHRDVWHFPKPTIAAVNGPALGGGCDLATLCDLRVCSDTAVFGHPEIKFGAPPLYTPLHLIVGIGHARQLCLTGAKVDAQQALRMGLVTSVVSDSELLDHAMTLAKTILEAPAQTLHYTKRFMSAASDFEEAFVREHDQPFTELLLKR